MSVRRTAQLFLSGLLIVVLGVAPAVGEQQAQKPKRPIDPSSALRALDQTDSQGARASAVKNLRLVGRGERLLPNATTDVWSHKSIGYLGTFDSPCGTGEGFRSDVGPVNLIQDVNAPGVVLFDVHNRNRPRYMGNLPSLEGSRINDVKVATMNSGEILVHSNEVCAGGDGGFEIYNMNDPRTPVHLASVRINEPNQVLQDVFGGVNRGVHNLFLFTQGSRDYVALATHGNAWFGSTQIFEITDPTAPEFVSAWGPELLCEEDFCSDDPYNETDQQVLVDTINEWIFGTGRTPGFGASTIRSVHDITVTDDGNLMYAAAWDSGLILLDISDPANPEVISQALDPENGSLDGEVNSHSAWPTEDGTTVVEAKEDFNAWVTVQPLSNFTFGDQPWNTIPGVGVSTTAGDDFEANQTGNMVTMVATSVTVNSGPLAGNEYPAEEGAGNQPKIADTGPVEAEAVWVGRGCDTDNFAVPGTDTPGIVDPHLNDPAGKIAVVRRGACSFSSKMGAAQAAGAIGIVVSNNLTNDTPWSGISIWDYSDPENPVLASTFETECSAAASPIPECDPFGTYSVHNVVVEKGFATLSWYSNGVIVVDIRDPYNPVEVARYNPTGEEFEAQNAGPQDVWGIWKERGRSWLYASDRNGGLYILGPRGRGSG
jgi:hypothetical protein